nr:hypothetical protein [Capillimicrobium parvum]
MDGEHFAGGEVGDRDVVVVGEREDAFAGVDGAESEVVHAVGAADRHAAFGIESVVAHAVVPWGVSVAGGGGLWGGAVGVAGGAPVQRSVRAALVVVLAKLV